MNALKVRNNNSNIKADSVLVQGDLSSMDETQRSGYYLKVCESLGLNPHTQPFEYIKLGGQLKLYATRACSDQLRKLHGVSITIHSRELVDDIYTVVARAEDVSGRTDEASGVVSVKGLSGEARANQLMKAETKAKRRVTLSICGLGWLDETEVDSIQPAPIKQTSAPVINAQPVQKDYSVLLNAEGEKKLSLLNAEGQKKLSTFRELVLAVENEFPGTMQKMLTHYKVDSVEALVGVQMDEASKSLQKKLGGKK